jgi:hypothetical protein
MKRCELCKIKFPDHLVQRLIAIDSHGVDHSVDRCCPICGLEELRDLHGIPNLEFTGDQAKRNYDEANAFLIDPEGYLREVKKC